MLWGEVYDLLQIKHHTSNQVERRWSTEIQRPYFKYCKPRCWQLLEAAEPHMLGVGWHLTAS